MSLRPLLIIVLLLGIGFVAAFILRARVDSKPTIAVLPVPDGDREIAWFHTSTNGASWEHFVAGIHHACRDNSNVVVDDSQAFLERTTATPEVVISWNGNPGKLRFRWYKQSNETGARQWIDALANRDPPPLAIIGGGTSDRAVELAQALEARKEWKGKPPLMLLTTATANVIDNEAGIESRQLMQIYPERSFRFCFTNEQMARAVVDFIWSTRDLRPRGGPAAPGEQAPDPLIFPVQWDDDPYSVNLSEEFRRAITAKTGGRSKVPFISHFPHSVGPVDRVNKAEADYAALIVDEIPLAPEQQTLLIVPSATTPARRFLRALTGDSPLIGRHLVVINGDAISINDVYRDGSLIWNVHDVPLPLVFFAHQNPVGWDEDLPPPAGTDEVLLFGKMAEVLVGAVHEPTDGARQPNFHFVSDADDLRDRLRRQLIVPFDEDGNRKDGEEYVVCVRPDITESGRVSPRASLEVWRRPLFGKGWEKVETHGPLQVPYVARTTRPIADAE